MSKSGTPSGAPPITLTRRSLLLGAGGAAVSPAIVRAAPLGSRSHVIVVGAGVFGAWTAHHLLQRGHKVTLIEAYGPAHSRSSSGGESRMTRAGYGKDEIYTRMALASLPQWQALSAKSGTPIFIPHGVLFFFAKEEAYLRDSLAVHRRLKLPTEALDRREMSKRFPMIDFTGVGIGMFEPRFGALMARRAVQTLVAGFVKAGGEYLQDEVIGTEERGGSLSLTLANRGRVGADRFVFALGAWLPKFFPDVIGRRIEPTRQEVFFFAPPAGDPLFTPARMPGWADFNAGDLYYGFPDLEARGVKFARDTHGPAVDPDTQDRQPTQAALADVISFRDRRFPRLRGALLTEARVCQYENSSNGDFLIDFHPRLSNVLLVGGGPAAGPRRSGRPPGRA